MRKNVLQKLFACMVMTLLLSVIPSSFVLAAKAKEPVISKKTFELMVGKTYDLDIKNVKKNDSCKWTTGDKKIATVDRNGLVKGISAGTALITCKVKTSTKTYTLYSIVTVTKASKTSISITNKPDTIELGQYMELSYKLSPASSKEKVTWKSSDDSIVKIDDKGRCMAFKEGEVTITAVTSSGAKDFVTFTVKKNESLHITADDIIGGKYLIANRTFKNVFISNSVGNQRIKNADVEIRFVDVEITGTLTSEVGVHYYAEVQKSNINRLEFTLPEDPKVDLMMDSVFCVGDGSVVNEAILKASASLIQQEKAEIKKLTLAIEGDGDFATCIYDYRGDMVIDSSHKTFNRIVLSGCEFGTVDILKGDGCINLVSDEEKASTIDTVNIKDDVFTIVGPKTNQIVMDESNEYYQLCVAGEVNKIINHGSKIDLSLVEKGFVSEIEDNLSKDNHNGMYVFLTDENYGECAYTIKAGDQTIKDIQLKDLDKLINNDWKDKSVPQQIPDLGITIKMENSDTYIILVGGAEIKMMPDFEVRAVTYFGSNNYKFVNIKVSEKQ